MPLSSTLMSILGHGERLFELFSCTRRFEICVSARNSSCGLWDLFMHTSSVLYMALLMHAVPLLWYEQLQDVAASLFAVGWQGERGPVSMALDL